MLTETEAKEKIRDLAVGMLKKVNQYKDISDKLEGIDLSKPKEIKSSDYANLAKALIKTENEFLEVYSQFPYMGSDKKIHYPIVTNAKKNIITEDFLDKVADAINGKEDQLNGENFATVLLGDAKFNNKPNIKYAVPQCIKGDITNATTFLCFLNPGSSVKDKTFGNLGMKKDDFHFYYQLQGARLDHSRFIDIKGDEEFINGMIKEMNDLSSNIIYTELKAIEDEMKSIVDNIDVDVNKLNEFKRNGDLDKLKKAIRDTLKLRKNQPWKDLSKLIGEKAYYINKYFKTYYGTSIEDFEFWLIYSLKNDTNFIENLKDSLDICNLELIPIRSKNISAVNALVGDNPFAINIILRRIFISELMDEDDKPVFVFRGYNTKKRWKHFFEQHVDHKLLTYLENNYFLKLSSESSAAFSPNNIITIPSEDNESLRVIHANNDVETKKINEKDKIEMAKRLNGYIKKARETFSDSLKTKENK